MTVISLYVGPAVAPSDIGGGGGTSRELTITWTVPVLMFLTWSVMYILEIRKIPLQITAKSNSLFKFQFQCNLKCTFKCLFYCTLSICVCRFQFISLIIQSISLKVFSPLQQYWHTPKLRVLFLSIFWRFLLRGLLIFHLHWFLQHFIPKKHGENAYI